MHTFWCLETLTERWVSSDTMLLSEAIKQFAIATRADGRSIRTVDSYRQKLAGLVTFLEDMPIEQVTINDLRAWIAHLMDRTTLYPGTDKERSGSRYTVRHYGTF